MGRDIKFRIWSKYSKKMFDDGFYLYQNGDLFQDDELYYKNKESFEIMQYTGLKDKNGKEIYEGDIVKGYYDEYDTYFAEDNRHEFVSEVKYIDNSFKVHRNTVNDEGRIRDFGYQHVWDNKTVEVIGNIFENPELLDITP